MAPFVVRICRSFGICVYFLEIEISLRGGVPSLFLGIFHEIRGEHESFRVFKIHDPDSVGIGPYPYCVIGYSFRYPLSFLGYFDKPPFVRVRYAEHGSRSPMLVFLGEISDNLHRFPGGFCPLKGYLSVVRPDHAPLRWPGADIISLVGQIVSDNHKVFVHTARDLSGDVGLVEDYRGIVGIGFFHLGNFGVRSLQHGAFLVQRRRAIDVMLGAVVSQLLVVSHQNRAIFRQIFSHNDGGARKSLGS